MSQQRVPASPSRRRTFTAVGIAAATATGVFVPASAGADETTNESHCVITIEGVQSTGEYITSDPVCFGTLAEALASAGAAVDPSARINASDVQSQNLAATAASGVIALHYDGFNRTSSSITISGSDCSGGYLNLSSDWTNRISSTLNFCPVVRFFDGFDKSGGSEATYAATINLGGLNNAANSVQYASS